MTDNASAPQHTIVPPSIPVVPTAEQSIPPRTPTTGPTVSSGGAPPPPPTPRITLPIIIAAVVATAIIVSGIFFGLSRMKPQVAQTLPTPTTGPVATPTPVRQPSALATQSAFINFQGAIATLSAAIATYNVQDPSLTPPTLVLPLGFSR